jgi:hypothetical protein
MEAALGLFCIIATWHRHSLAIRSSASDDSEVGPFSIGKVQAI